MGSGVFYLGGHIMEWVMLLLAGVFEVTWALAIKESDGFSRLLPSIVTCVGYNES